VDETGGTQAGCVIKLNSEMTAERQGQGGGVEAEMEVKAQDGTAGGAGMQTRWVDG